MQQWFKLRDPAVEEARHDMVLFRDFAGHQGGRDKRLPDEATILRLWQGPEKHRPAPQIRKAVNELLLRKVGLPQSSRLHFRSRQAQARCAVLP